MSLHSTDQKINLGSENHTFILKKVNNFQEHTWGRFLALEVEKCKIIFFCGFISYLCRVCFAIAP